MMSRTKSTDDMFKSILKLAKKKETTLIDTGNDDINFCYTAGRSAFDQYDFISAIHVPFSQAQFVFRLYGLFDTKNPFVQFIKANALGLHGDYSLKVVPLCPNDALIQEFAHMSEHTARITHKPWRIAQLVWPDASGHYLDDPKYNTKMHQIRFKPLIQLN